MPVSLKYWNECVEPLDVEALWMDPQVKTEWLDAGEERGQKVHLSRDPDGQPYLTQTEMRAVAEIVSRRHYHSKVDLDMICALAELESDRILLTTRYVKKTKETTYGIMQITPQITNFLYREHGYRTYQAVEEGEENLLFRPFLNLYFGIAYLKYLANFEQRERDEEFVVRAYSGGTKKATHKSTLPYWNRYVSVKECLPSRKIASEGHATDENTDDIASASSDDGFTYWDSRACQEDMEEMWNHPEVQKQWMKSREQRGQVRFFQNAEKRLYLSRVELKAVAEIILVKHFSAQVIKPAALCAIVEIISARFIDGNAPRIGLTGIDFATASWLHNDLGYKAYRVESTEELRKPFVSMYYGAAYMTWLSTYESRERTPQFIVQAYLYGPKNANVEVTCPEWLKYEEALSYYHGDMKRESGSCKVM